MLTFWTLAAARFALKRAHMFRFRGIARRATRPRPAGRARPAHGACVFYVHAGRARAHTERAGAPDWAASGKFKRAGVDFALVSKIPLAVSVHVRCGQANRRRAAAAPRRPRAGLKKAARWNRSNRTRDLQRRGGSGARTNKAPLRARRAAASSVANCGTARNRSRRSAFGLALLLPVSGNMAVPPPVRRSSARDSENTRDSQDRATASLFRRDRLTSPFSRVFETHWSLLVSSSICNPSSATPCRRHHPLPLHTCPHPSNQDHFQAPNRSRKCLKTINVLLAFASQAHRMSGNYSKKSAIRPTTSLQVLSGALNATIWRVIMDI